MGFLDNKPRWDAMWSCPLNSWWWPLKVSASTLHVLYMNRCTLPPSLFVEQIFKVCWTKICCTRCYRYVCNELLLGFVWPKYLIPVCCRFSGGTSYPCCPSTRSHPTSRGRTNMGAIWRWPEGSHAPRRLPAVTHCCISWLISRRGNYSAIIATSLMDESGPIWWKTLPD